MNAFSKSISLIFQGAGKAFRSFPASMICAVAFTIVTMIRIQLDWPDQEPHHFLFTCLHWGFAAGAAFSLAVAVWAQSRSGKTTVILGANLSGLLVAAGAFLTLYLPGGLKEPGVRFARLSELSTTRAGAFVLVSLLLFILLAGWPKDRSDFARSFFLFHKALVVALIYGGVLMAGTSGVARAIQALLYKGMSEKVYAYLGTMVGLLAYAIFAGYFPDFRKVSPGATDERREAGQNQPRFIEILFGMILTPVLLALTAVLLLWAVRILTTGEWPNFNQLSGIAASYSLGGLWLHIMTTHHETRLVRFYQRFYPFAALVILAFEAMALVNQLGRESLKTESYLFGLIWVLAVAAAILLIVLREHAHPPIVLLACALVVVCVFPGTNWQTLPVTAQVNRLENLLTSQGMLSGNDISPAPTEPDKSVRISVTDAVAFLSGSETRDLPAWYDRDLRNDVKFRERMGFEKIWPEYGDDLLGNSYRGTSLMLKPGALDTSKYRWSVIPQDDSGNGSVSVVIEGERGQYRVRWSTMGTTRIPSLTIELDDRVILQENMNAFIDEIAQTYEPGQPQPVSLPPEEMGVAFETPEMEVLLLFSHIEINVNPSRDDMGYWMDLRMLYMMEK